MRVWRKTRLDEAFAFPNDSWEYVREFFEHVSLGSWAMLKKVVLVQWAKRRATALCRFIQFVCCCSLTYVKHRVVGAQCIFACFAAAAS